VRYGCLKITKYSEDNIRIGKQGSTWDNGDTWDNGPWDNFKLKLNLDSLRFLKKKYHSFLLTSPFCMNESFPCSL
jgi:hypothetical protein